MTLRKLILTLAVLDVQVTIKAGRLSLCSRKGVLTDQLKQTIKQYDDNLMSLVKTVQDAGRTRAKILIRWIPAIGPERGPAPQAASYSYPIYWTNEDLFFIRTEWLEEVADSDRVIAIWLEALGEAILLVGNNTLPIHESVVAGRVIYTSSDFGALRDVTPDHLRMIHQAKSLFGGDISNPDEDMGPL